MAELLISVCLMCLATATKDYSIYIVAGLFWIAGKLRRG